MVKKRKEVKLTLHVYSDTNPELYAWLTSLDEQPQAHGAKLQKVRETLLAGLRGGAVAATGGVAVTAAVNVDGLAAQLANVLLPQMRPVMEAAVTSGLQGCQLAPGAPGRASEPEDDGAFADDLVAGLMLGDD